MGAYLGEPKMGKNGVISVSSVKISENRRERNENGKIFAGVFGSLKIRSYVDLVPLTRARARCYPACSQGRKCGGGAECAQDERAPGISLPPRVPGGERVTGNRGRDPFLSKN